MVHGAPKSAGRTYAPPVGVAVMNTTTVLLVFLKPVCIMLLQDQGPVGQAK